MNTSQHALCKKHWTLSHRPVNHLWLIRVLLCIMGLSSAAVVAVTGVSGYIGSEIVKQLLEKGYTVRGTVRSTSNTAKVQHLLKLFDALPGKLELFEADLLQPGDFDKVLGGADFLMHTASPFLTKVEDPQRDLIDPAVNGTTSVLDAAGKAGVKRVVVTSSVAGIELPIVVILQARLP